MEIAIAPQRGKRSDATASIVGQKNVLPTAYSVEQAAYTFRTEAAGRPLLTGALPFSWGDTLHRRLVDPGRPWVAPILAELGVRWIVVHGDAYARAGVTPPVPRGASLVKRFGGDSLWKVDVRTPPVGTYPGPEFAGLEPGNGAPSYQWLFGDHGRFVVWNNRERDVPVIVRMEVISFAIDRHVTVRAGDRVVARAVVPASPSRITFRYTAPPGMSELGVESREPAQRVGDVLGNGDARVVSFQVGAITTTSANADGSPDRRNPVLTVR